MENREIEAKLIKLGSCYQDEVILNDLLMQLGPYGHVNARAISDWQSTAKSLPLDQLCDLIRGLTLAERELGWPGGSVSGVIWLFRYLMENHEPGIYEPIADWVLRERKNHYIPFGTFVVGCKSYAEYLVFRKNKNTRYSIHLSRESELKLKAKSRKQKQRTQIETTSRIRGTPDQIALREKLRGLTTLQQLQVICHDTQLSISFYPKYIAGAATSEFLSNVDLELLEKLYERLRGKRRGPWGQFKKRVAKALVLKSKKSQETQIIEKEEIDYLGIEFLLGMRAQSIGRDQNELISRMRTLPQGLVEAYMDTSYLLHLPDGECEVRLDAEVPPALTSLLQSKILDSWAVISAYNPYSQQTSEEDNSKRHGLLNDILNLRNYLTFPAVGSSKDGSWKEPSILVLGLSYEVAQSLGAIFQQNAIVFSELEGPIELVFCEREPLSN